MERGKKKNKKVSKKEEKKRLAEERRAAKRIQKGTQSVAEPFIQQLEKIAARDPAAIAPLLNSGRAWEQHACGNHTLACASTSWVSATRAECTIDDEAKDCAKSTSDGEAEDNTELFDQVLRKAATAQLHARGCTIAENVATTNTTPNPLLPPRPTFSWGAKYQDMLRRIDASMESLKHSGWPPVFVFLFDEPWLLIDRLFELVGPILGEECLLEASVYGWALSRGGASVVHTDKESGSQQVAATAATAATAEVGGNFPLPHRDNSFAECNFPNGTPSHLSTWMCVNDVGLDNGCMHVLPKDSDNRFDMTNDYWHERVAYPSDQVPELQKAAFSRKMGKPPKEQIILNFPSQHALPMPAPRGSVLLWQPNCIHWGSSCSPSTHLSPRKSLAMSFRCSNKKRKIETYERNLLTRNEVRKMSVEDRLVMVAESMLMYSKWFPSFRAFDLDLLLSMPVVVPETEETKSVEENGVVE